MLCVRWLCSALSFCDHLWGFIWHSVCVQLVLLDWVVRVDTTNLQDRLIRLLVARAVLMIRSIYVQGRLVLVDNSLVKRLLSLDLLDKVFCCESVYVLFYDVVLLLLYTLNGFANDYLALDRRLDWWVLVARLGMGFRALASLILWWLDPKHAEMIGRFMLSQFMIFISKQIYEITFWRFLVCVLVVVIQWLLY